MTEEAKSATRMQRAFRMHEVPPEKWHRIVLRTIIGAVLFLAGIGILYGVVRSYIAAPEQMSLALLLTGVGLFGIGAHMISGQMFTGSVKAVISVAGSAKRLLPGAGKANEGE